MKSFSLAGRTAVVTGGSRGIGAAIVETFVEHGARVFYCHVGDEARAEALDARLSTDGRFAKGTVCDVADEQAVAAFFDGVRQEADAIDILVNCAGIGGDKPFGSITVADWDTMMGVHLRGTFLATRQVFDDMVSRRYGRIINFASQLAYKGAPNLAHYCAAKAGIVGFTRALSYEGAPHDVLVNAIAPGPVETELLMGMSDSWRAMKMGQLPIGRFGQPDEIAPAVLLLASESGSYFVGQTLSPNGGDVMI
ncbi:3-oxoacyl-[acyl-carrier protein] reductase [Kaistia soli DSM 19436]|uniref:3-oxoacyl-[acyl-carrier protein] reductase n=1 Tax=Kaistia soli DSM 19436 TaxID=1122133 RepID=A0A1M5G9Z1_9HYPH|nr:3-oxoacyl-ACP reductase family protein [Kaistia soli]SHG00526.1 3-oxoacyl-[acyl-carrier protein] reductase [Kaistia soli DSM 19436]